MMLLGGVVLIAIGLMCIFARDHLWQMTRWRNQTEGLASERTDWWDATTILTGVGSIIFGAVLIGWVLLNPQPSAADVRATDNARNTANTDMVATFTGRMTQTWQETLAARTATAAPSPTATPTMTRTPVAAAATFDARATARWQTATAASPPAVMTATPTTTPREDGATS